MSAGSNAGPPPDRAPRGEQRAHARRVLELPVLVSDAGNRVYGAILFDTRDLSLGGAFVRTDLLFEVGEELDLEFQLPATTVERGAESGRAPAAATGAEGPVVKARGRVVRVAREAGGGAGMGIAFSHMADGDREAVERLLDLRPQAPRASSPTS